MTIDVYSATGTKKGTLELPEALFAVPVNTGLMHQFMVLQQSNRRSPVAHVKTRGEVVGSTKKLFQQKGTGRARRGPIRSPLLRGGGKTFGPRSDANFIKDMPKSMRHAALRSCLTFQAKNKGTILGLEGYGAEIKTSTAYALLKKIPVELGRKILIVIPEKHEGLSFSVRNIPGVKAVLVNYLNPEDVMGSRNIVFVGDAVKKAEEMFGPKKIQRLQKEKKSEAVAEAPAAPKKKSAPKKTSKKTT